MNTVNEYIDKILNECLRRNRILNCTDNFLRIDSMLHEIRKFLYEKNLDSLIKVDVIHVESTFGNLYIPEFYLYKKVSLEEIQGLFRIYGIV